METNDPCIDTDILELQPTHKTAIRGKPVALYILSQALGGGGSMMPVLQIRKPWHAARLKVTQRANGRA